MLISEVIAMLQKEQAARGDITLYIADPYGNIDPGQEYFEFYELKGESCEGFVVVGKKPSCVGESGGSSDH